MVFKHFRFQMIIRLGLLTGTIVLALSLGMASNLFATTILLAIGVLVQIWLLFRFVDRTNHDLSRFLRAIRYEDFTQTFPTKSGDSFAELNQAFTEVITHFKKTRTEKEEHYHYLQTVVQHVGIGLLSYDQNGEIDLYNGAAKRMLRYPNPRSIRAFEYFSPEFVSVLSSIKTGERRLVKTTHQDDILHISIHATEMKLRDRHVMLVSLQNIQSELEEKEMEAWHSLIRVLTHEMMNSVTPISSLAATSKTLISDTESIAKEDLGDIRNALETIQRRSEGLLHFVETYRQLTRIPKPDYQIVGIESLFDNVCRLMETELEGRSIQLLRSVEPESLEVTADGDLIEQVLINLILNARDALSDSAEGVIVLQAQLDERGRVLMRVSDNGPGIEPGVIANIFIPFFTTKKTGSGIGLSLSKQIMRLHHGSLSVQSEPGSMTSFTLRF